MSITEKENEGFLRLKEKGEDDYEKNIIYIAAGTLVLSLTFLEKIVNLEETNAVWYLIWSWIFLSITLLSNLVSHQLSSLYIERCRIFYANCGDDRTYPDKKLKIYIKRLSAVNWSATATLFLGISLLVIFCSINAYKVSHSKLNENTIMSKSIKPQIHQPDLQKGRLPSQPVSVPTQKPTVQPQINPPQK
jgi:hypothetical protein